MVEATWTSVEFTGQQTYSGVRKVFAEAVPEGRGWGSRVLEICKYPGETGLSAWVLCLPEKTIYREPYGRLPSRHLTGKKTLQECKAIARRVILAAGGEERLEELRTATEVPEWAKTPKGQARSPKEQAKTLEQA